MTAGKKIGNRQKAKIHIAKQQLGMSDDEYRSMLSRFGVESSKDLAQNQWASVEAYLKKLGFVARVGKPKTKRATKSRFQWKINEIKQSMGLTDNYIDGIAFQMHGKVLSRCKTEEVQSVMKALIIYQQRHA